MFAILPSMLEEPWYGVTGGFLTTLMPLTVNKQIRLLVLFFRKKQKALLGII